ncbi:uncharacterized protein E0L32_004915 [Thyridium curvatum]|uniref:Uncharacterized protein n=1 Tax=Thyridium curvatum TaxID=1093900 RepID=A0A507AWD3_9PEZI|nr:uncharacterized protein E0L32_004915 [Thyridium curvatum]TPX15085.1 hypothetical protein E0L32_004915 [Thyridium curvatum]
MSVVDDYLDSPMDGDDVFPCKGCGEILEEGKAFELAGNRWHLNCFRCNTCGTLLDSDANLLLLGDGSLICNNCTYSCSACNNKIEDLAILTGDQAFCATCFRCRNCKRKIENLRYARTSQGIFCMSCHESLMARRRKKSKAAAQAKAREKDASPMLVDKSLPALPPNAIPPGAFASPNDNPSSENEAPTELSPRPRPTYPRNDSSSRDSPRTDRSPERQSESARDTSLSLPATSYRNNRNSTILAPPAEISGGDGDSFFIPVALDPSPAPSTTPRSTAENLSEANRRNKDKDYFTAKSNERKPESQASTPHIAFQDKGQKGSSEYEDNARPPREPSRKLSKSSRNDARSDKGASAKASPAVSDENRKPASVKTEEFKLQDAPKSKKSGAGRTNSQSAVSLDSGRNRGNSGARKDQSGSPPSLAAADKAGTPRSSQDSRFKDDDEERPSQDTASSQPRPIARKELPSSAARNVNGKSVPPSVKSHNSEELVVPPRPGMPEQKLSDTYMQPRAPPQPPPRPAHTPGSASVSSFNEPPSPPTGPSPSLPRWSAGGDFSMEEDMARILGTDEGSSSILRRVSNAVRHGRTNSTESSQTAGRMMGHHRSVSETTRATASPRWPKTPIAEHDASHSISSPISVTGGAKDDPAFLKRQLRDSEQRVAELERQFNTEKDLKNLNKKLIEKRKTVSILDTQTEIMIRQLEVLAGYVERAKESKKPVDPRDLEDSAIKEFVQKLDKVKYSMSAAIEQLHAERDELIEEKNQAMADRDRALMEFEQLSSKNAQLADMNNDLTHQIQERFKSQINTDIKSPGAGLGIYHTHKGPSNSSTNLDTSSIQTGQATLVSTDGDEPIVESGPTVVNIRKGQVRKFNWKKGSKTVAHGLSKGMNRAVGAFQQQPERGQYGALTGDSIGLPYNMTVAQVESPVQVGPNGQTRIPSEASRQGFGFFSKKNAPVPKSNSSANVSMATVPEAPTTLFGSDLVERADYERRQIPSVVTRCIEEVELRGMDIEGIYRKTGGNSQVKMIQEGFDKNEDFDISDPGLDITAVTSVLKQYFRKLPNPLLTFEVYERILESNSITGDEDRCAHLRKTVNMLPAKHRDCLEFLMFHLARVASRERENLMSPKNLAVVFAPTIMRDHSLEKEMTDMHAKNLAVQYVIEHSDEIFGEE